MSGELGGPSVDDIQDRKLGQLQVYVVIGLFGTAAITKAEPRDFWERAVEVAGSNLDDLGIPDVPTEPGWYRWYGRMSEEKAKGPGLKGGYESVYKGEWVKMMGAAP